MASRRLRAFKRWMKAHGVECCEALDLVDSPEEGISVRALCDLKVGDVVAKIPKSACLTIRTSGAREMIESAGLDGSLGLAVALMYEKSLGEESPWAGYLQLLPYQEDLPLVWSPDEIDTLLCGTELHKVVKEDKDLIYEDWKENILPLIESPILKLNPEYFAAADYFASRCLIASRSFGIDDYHGYGMVPLADLFNHKTGTEDVHFTSASSHSESESEAEDSHGVHGSVGNDDYSAQSSYLSEKAFEKVPGEISYCGADNDSPSVSNNDHSVLEMIMVKDVIMGAEVFNTYGLLGNAALLHRYGFTELKNQYDIVNIDLELVFQWGSSIFSRRYTKARFSLWRKLGYSGCDSQNSEYFEISSDGEPQVELLILLYILLLPEDTYNNLDLAISTAGDKNGFINVIFSGKDVLFDKTSEINKDIFLTNGVCKALAELANKRDNLYGSNSIEDDVEALKRCSSIKKGKLYHSSVLRVCEREVLEKLRSFANGMDLSSKFTNEISCRKKVKT